MVNFSTMSSKEKDEHVKELWRLCFLRSLGGSQIKLSCNKMIKRVVKYGTTKNINAKKASDDMIFVNKRESSVIYPDNLFFTYWSILMFFLIIYVAFWMPIQVSFLTAKTSNFLNLDIQEYIDYGVDFLFLIDLIINFFTAIEKEQNGNLIYITKKKLIAKNYLEGWFWVDFIALLPASWIENLLGDYL